MRNRMILGGFGIVLLAIQPAWSATLFPIERKCPVGGKKFKENVRVAWTDYGPRPDGRQFTNYVSPQPIPECPDNHLLMVRDFTEDEVKRLKPLIESAEYKAMIGKEKPYFRAWWLMSRLGADPARQLGYLQRAKWESDDAPTLKEKYTRMMVDAARDVSKSKTAGQPDWWQMQWMITNGLRELGDFAGASAFMDSLPIASLAIPAPEKKLGNPPVIEEEVTPFPGMKPVKRKRDNVLNQKDIDTARTSNFLHDSFGKMRKVIAARDATPEPLMLLPLRETVQRCDASKATLNAELQSYCATMLERWKAAAKS